MATLAAARNLFVRTSAFHFFMVALAVVGVLVVGPRFANAPAACL